MSTRPSIGYIKTFSSGLGSGSVEVQRGATTMSLPFTSKVVEGMGTRLRSGDRVQVTLRQQGSKKPRVITIELAPAPPKSTGSPENKVDEPAASSRTEDAATSRVSVLSDGGTAARFTKESFVRSGSRLDFSL